MRPISDMKKRLDEMSRMNRHEYVDEEMTSKRLGEEPAEDRPHEDPRSREKREHLEDIEESRARLEQHPEWEDARIALGVSTTRTEVKMLREELKKFLQNAPTSDQALTASAAISADGLASVDKMVEQKGTGTGKEPAGTGKEPAVTAKPVTAKPVTAKPVTAKPVTAKRGHGDGLTEEMRKVREKILEMLAKNPEMSDRGIAKIAGCSAMTVGRLRKNRGE